MPTIAKVKEYQADAGFVVITAGKSQAHLERNGLTFVAKTLSSAALQEAGDIIEDAEHVADLDSKSVPAGVTVKVDDEVIQVVVP